MSYEVDVLTTTTELDQLAEEWQTLFASNPRLTPFQDPRWALPWARTFVRGPMVILAVRDGGALVAIVPLFRHDVDGERRLRLLGDGISDYLDAIVAADPRGVEGLEAALATLRDLRGDARAQARGLAGWDVCHFEQLAPGSALASVRADGWSSQVGEGESCPVLAVPFAEAHEAGDTTTTARAAILEHVVPREAARAYRRARRRAERDGSVQVHVADAATTERHLERLFELHTLRWRTRSHEPGIFANPAVRAFHLEVATALAPTDALRLYALAIGGHEVAVLYALTAHGRAYFYAQGFDPDFAAASPGVLVVGAALENTLARGAVEIDMLRGREPYKYAWGAVDRPTQTRRLVPLACP